MNATATERRHPVEPISRRVLSERVSLLATREAKGTLLSPFCFRDAGRHADQAERRSDR